MDLPRCYELEKDTLGKEEYGWCSKAQETKNELGAVWR